MVHALAPAMSVAQPTDADKQRGIALVAEIRRQIAQAGGRLSFADFMAAALYHPTLGYYNAETFCFGDRGDFTTAPELSALFAQSLASTCASLFAQCPLLSRAILELGAGSGRLAADLFAAWQSMDYPLPRYYLVEQSALLRRKQQALLQTLCPQWLDQCVFLDTLPERFSGIVIANEFLDALPVHCFLIAHDQIQEGYVSDQHHGFSLQFDHATNEQLIAKVARLQRQYSLPVGYRSELSLTTVVAEVTQLLEQGVILLIDYGYGEAHYYHPARMGGTLRCFWRHQDHDNPLINIGMQDISAHVDFSAVLAHAIAAGGELMGFATQATFLLTTGLVERASRQWQTTYAVAEQLNIQRAVKYLTLPTEMGERVRVLAISKNIVCELPPWCHRDRRSEL